MKLTVIGCSPAWPNAGGAQSGYLVEGDGRAAARLRPGRAARACASSTAAGRASTRSSSRTSTSTTGATSCRGSSARSSAPAATCRRPSSGCRPAAASGCARFGRRAGFGERDRRRLRRPRVRGRRRRSRPPASSSSPLACSHYYARATFGCASRTAQRRSRTPATPRRATRLVELARDADLFLCEATLREPEPAQRGHLSDRTKRDRRLRGVRRAAARRHPPAGRAPARPDGRARARRRRPRVLVPRPVDDRSSSIDRFLQRYPHAVVGIDDELRIVFSNEHARVLLGDDATRVGAQLDPRLRLVAEQLVLLHRRRRRGRERRRGRSASPSSRPRRRSRQRSSSSKPPAATRPRGPCTSSSGTRRISCGRR